MTDTTALRGQLATRAEQTTAVAQNDTGGPKTITDLINQQRTEIARALPKHMDADRLARIALTTMKTTPQLLECTPQSLLGALMLSAQTGMEPGPLGHAYLVPRRNKGVMECTWILGYKGIIELARRSGQIVSIEAREVCEADEFDYQYGLDEQLVHKPFMGGERGPIVAFWGLAKFKDGGHYFLVMSKADVDAAMQRSDAGKRGYGPWVSDYAAMGRKTVIRRMAPFLPLSSEQAAVIGQDESVHTTVHADMAAEPPATSWFDAPANDTPALAAVPPVPVDEDGVIDGREPAGEGDPATPEPAGSEPDKVGDLMDALEQSVEKARDARQARVTPAHGGTGDEGVSEQISEPQRKALNALLRSKHEVIGPQRFPVLSGLLDREVTAMEQITGTEAAQLIDELQGGAPDPDEDGAA